MSGFTVSNEENPITFQTRCWEIDLEHAFKALKHAFRGFWVKMRKSHYWDSIRSGNDQSKCNKSLLDFVLCTMAS